MSQSITIQIAGKTYNLKAKSPEQEQLMRLAAESINKKLSEYDARFSGTEFSDKLAFVTLNEAVSRLAFQNKLASLEKSIESLEAETDSYLKSIEIK